MFDAVEKELINFFGGKSVISELINFAKDNGLQQKPFIEVIDFYIEYINQLEEYYDTITHLRLTWGQ